MTRPTIRKLALAAAAMTLVVGIAYALTEQTLPPDAGSNCATSLTPAEFNAWFESGAVSLNGAVKPANSVTFPDIPNCSFYEWSEQMFLWLTSPAPPRYGGGGGLVMNSPAFYDVTPPDENTGIRQFVPHKSGFLRVFNLRSSQKGILDLPVIMEKRTLRLLEILPTVTSREGLPMVADQKGNQLEVRSVRWTTDGKPVLFDRSGREILGPRAILEPQFAKKIERLGVFDRSELIQRIILDKSIITLDLFGNFPETEQAMADGTILMAQNGSLVYYALTVNNVFALYRTMQGASVPAGTQFPVTQADLDAIEDFATLNGHAPVIDPEALAIEIKSAWIESSSLADPSKFIQMKAVVPTYDTSNPNDWVQNGTKTTMLAMVGMHVVGSTKGHPEMLWGTFEHVSNGPLETYNYSKTPSGTTTIADGPYVGDWLFSANGSTGPFNEPHMIVGGPGHVTSLSPFTVSPSDTRREKPWGLDSSAANGNAQVISLNNTVRSLLDPADVRKNYVHVGTTWTIFGAPPNGSNQVGTNKLSNTTMETYTQGANCFACHGTNTTAVSHIFDSTDPLF
jgi:hypothetical protein